MKARICLLAPALLAFVGCVGEPVPVTTTTVTREVTTTGPATDEIVVAQAPPAVRVEARVVSPGPGYVYSSGYWQWTRNRHVWVSGKWINRPRPAAVWVEGHWARRPGGWVWISGHWR